MDLCFIYTENQSEVVRTDFGLIHALEPYLS